jgi:hypothetical protein
LEFERLVMQEERVTLTAIVLPSSPAVIDYVASHARAVGYVPMSSLILSKELETSVDQQRVRILRVEGEVPTQESVHAGSYHLTSPVHLVVVGSESSALSEWLDFMLSAPGQATVRRGLVGVR